MGEHSNLPAGSRVPVTGRYKCEFCGEGGLAEAIGRRFKETQKISFQDMEKLARDRKSQKLLNEGDSFPECDNCGRGALWTLVSKAEGEGEGKGSKDLRRDESLWPKDVEKPKDLWSDE